MISKISITAISSLSALNNSCETILDNYLNENHCLQLQNFNQNLEYVGAMGNDFLEEIEFLQHNNIKYKNLDKSVLYAIITSRKAIEKAGWTDKKFGINIGSSRGATALFEAYHKEFVLTGKTNVLTSPTTTLGNISSWVAHDLQTSGPEISHSITCSTALHALLNGVVWLKSGMANHFLVGGSEAPLTDFTIAQMKALKIYVSNTNAAYPCKALDINKLQNTMVLGEGAAMCCIENGVTEKSLAIIENIGYATEILEHSISISAEANCFQKSMAMALQNIEIETIDVIVMHAPGTKKGDLSELKAIEKVFGNHKPLLTSNKWKTGHTLGASGMLSVEMAVVMLQNQVFIGIPYIGEKTHPKKINKIMINAVGFGGNAVSVILSKI